MPERPRRAALARCGAATVVALVVSTAWARPAPGDEVTSEELSALAQRAADDPAALQRLRRVDEVDGRRVDLERALDAPAPEVAQRVRALAAPASRPPSVTVDAARGQARDILDERRFRPRRAPRPLAGLLKRIGGWLRPVGEPVGNLVGKLGKTGVAVVAAGATVIVATLVGTRVARRRTAADVAGEGAARGEARADPAQLERQAEEEERRGQLDRAFRLRFHAGLLRLDEAGLVRLRGSLTTGELVRTVPSATLAQLAATLEEIVYGGRPARPPDLDAARSGWPQVLGESRP